MLPFIGFGTLNRKMVMRRLDWLQITKKDKLTCHRCLTHYIPEILMYTDWLALINRAISSRAVGTQVQENLLLLSNNSLLSSKNCTFRGISSPLRRYYDDNARRGHRSVPHSFPENSYCCLCILIVRPCILKVVYVFLLLSTYYYCSSMYSYRCLCILRHGYSD
jgi:hypothetical protein